ncbi:hypothetical protein RFI_06747, partial [Reticulomyxa filosa]
MENEVRKLSSLSCCKKNDEALLTYLTDHKLVEPFEVEKVEIIESHHIEILFGSEISAQVFLLKFLKNEFHHKYFTLMPFTMNVHERNTHNTNNHNSSNNINNSNNSNNNNVNCHGMTNNSCLGDYHLLSEQQLCVLNLCVQKRSRDGKRSEHIIRRWRYLGVLY